MAEDKKSFILYADQKILFDDLTDDEAGKLIKHIFSYVNDENPETDDKIIKITFGPIKQQLKRDLKSWEEKRRKKSEAGRLGMEARWKNRPKVITEDNTVKQSITNITVNDNVNVNVTHRDMFFSDLKNSRVLEIVASNNKLTIDTVKSLIPEFEKSADVEYPDFNRFCNHFKNWVPIYISKTNPQPIKLKGAWHKQ